MSHLRRNLYKAARLMGDAEAASKGPSAYVKRRVRPQGLPEGRPDHPPLSQEMGTVMLHDKHRKEAWRFHHECYWNYRGSC
jgi:hypothetical protein